MAEKITEEAYSQHLKDLHIELAKLQDWVVKKKLRIVVLFEGRDAAGKGGVIKRLTEKVSPRVFKTVALSAPNSREKSQMYLQRYIQHLPAAGEVTIFDRSWYNRAGVERVMGYCKKSEWKKFLHYIPSYEQNLIEDGIILIKYWLTVSSKEQKERFQARIKDPRRQWKLSAVDLESRKRWYDYSVARDEMLTATDTSICPWHIVDSNDKLKARLNCIRHFLDQIPYKDISKPAVELPERDKKMAYEDEKSLEIRNFVPSKY